MQTRYAYVRTGAASASAKVETVRGYLPTNYRIIADTREGVIIAGEDSAGWTLQDYVLPRLASGLYFGQEIEHAGDFARLERV